METLLNIRTASGLPLDLPTLMEEVNKQSTTTLAVGGFVVLLSLFMMLKCILPGKGAKKLPPVVPGYPLIGSFLEFSKNPVGYVKSMYPKYGSCFTVNLFNQKMTYLLGPEAHDVFFRGTDEEVSQREVYQFTVPVFGPGVVYDAPSHITTQQIRMVRHAMAVRQLHKYSEMIVKEAKDFFDGWGNEGTIDLVDEMGKLTILTAARCLMGHEIREHLFAEVAELYHHLDGGMTPLSVVFPNAPIPRHFKRNWARDEMIKLFTKVITERKAKGQIEEDDVLQIFMNATYKDGTPLTESEVTGMLICLLFAGQHTSSITASWTGLLIMNEKKKFLPRLMEEQQRVMAQYNDQITFDSVGQMEFLHVCVKEALRMFPPLVFLMRRVKKEQVFGDITIPEGHNICVSPAVAHRVGGTYKNPDAFEPERFLAPREEDKAAPFSYIGFGGGRHACMGENFGFLQVKTIWSYLLNNFDIELESPLPEPDYQAMVVGPKKPSLIRYKRKSTSAK